MEASAAHEYLPKPTEVTVDYMREVMDQYYMRKWNPNKDTVISVKSWRDWPMIVRMPDLQKDFTVMIDEGKVLSVTQGQAENPRILTIMLAETMQRIYYDESTAAIELIAGRIKVRGNETERRRMLAAISYLTW
ncbi:MAG: hypothetical protein ABW006_07755 [Hyphomicrobium sp.]|jgi:hypothetical protein|uniref:hypothetical protein n=1 Tax=Hyphomicrobium sp. TaxID=82 RepID=UPI0034757E3B